MTSADDSTDASLDQGGQPPGPDHPDDLDGYGLGRRAVALMHLDQPCGTLAPAQVAFVLGNDPTYIIEQIDIDEQQSSLAAADAASARRSGSDDSLSIAVDLHESRAWAASAQMKRDALAYLKVTNAAPVEFVLDVELRSIRRAEWAWLSLRSSCMGATECNGSEDQCGVHGAERIARKHEYDGAITELRRRFDAVAPGA